MFCSNCGKQLDENAKFCDGCGAKTGEVEQINSRLELEKHQVLKRIKSF